MPDFFSGLSKIGVSEKDTGGVCSSQKSDGTVWSIGGGHFDKSEAIVSSPGIKSTSVECLNMSLFCVGSLLTCMGCRGSSVADIMDGISTPLICSTSPLPFSEKDPAMTNIYL